MLPFDLHVLGTPPAFILSQDQTLKLDLKPLNRLITTFDEVPPFFVDRSQRAARDSHRWQRWCNL